MIDTAHASFIVGAVSASTGVRVSDILGESRERTIVRARWETYLALVNAGASYSQTGRLMQRDHSTIMHGVAKARQAQIVNKVPHSDSSPLAATAEGTAGQRASVNGGGAGASFVLPMAGSVAQFSGENSDV